MLLTSPVFTPTAKVKALCDYIGQPAPGAGRTVLSFRKNNMIEIVNSSDPQWWKVRDSRAMVFWGERLHRTNINKDFIIKCTIIVYIAISVNRGRGQFILNTE